MTEHSRTWLTEEIESVDMEVAYYPSTYHVDSPDDLVDLIRQHRVVEHPSWEDAISWENMLDYRAKLVAELATLDARQGRDASTPGPQAPPEAGTPE